MSEAASIRVGVLTVSDRSFRGARPDRSGAVIVEWCERHAFDVVHRQVVPDETAAIAPVLAAWADGVDATEGGARDPAVDLIVTTGGTGLTERDVTPEATRAVIEREAPGLAEEFRRRGLAATPHAILSRGVAGTRGRTLIVNLPGSPGGVADGLAVLDGVVVHAVALLRGDHTPHEPGGTGS